MCGHNGLEITKDERINLLEFSKKFVRKKRLIPNGPRIPMVIGAEKL